MNQMWVAYIVHNPKISSCSERKQKQTVPASLTVLRFDGTFSVAILVQDTTPTPEFPTTPTLAPAQLREQEQNDGPPYWEAKPNRTKNLPEKCADAQRQMPTEEARTRARSTSGSSARLQKTRS